MGGAIRKERKKAKFPGEMIALSVIHAPISILVIRSYKGRHEFPEDHVAFKLFIPETLSF